MIVRVSDDGLRQLSPHGQCVRFEGGWIVHRTLAQSPASVIGEGDALVVQMLLDHGQEIRKMWLQGTGGRRRWDEGGTHDVLAQEKQLIIEHATIPS